MSRWRDLVEGIGPPRCGHKTRLGRCFLDQGHSGPHQYPDRVAQQRRRRQKGTK